MQLRDPPESSNLKALPLRYSHITLTGTFDIEQKEVNNFRACTRQTERANRYGSGKPGDDDLPAYACSGAPRKPKMDWRRNESAKQIKSFMFFNPTDSMNWASGKDQPLQIPMPTFRLKN
ncbi:hypothetical protein O9929_24025 [Vibrio lentus]|nr:hypothetical protein [Vibrio lentus]